MRRRDFIKLSGQFSIGALVLPNALSMACRKEDLFEEASFNGKVTIIGAGAAGLYAAYVLKSKNIDFEILEASNKIGGRLGKLEGFADFSLDKGAQWLHGRNNILGDLIRKTNTKISKDNSDEFYWFNQQLVSSLPRDVNAIFEEKEGLPDISFNDYRIQKGFGEEYEYIVEGIAGDQGADASRLSVYSNIKEEENWSSGDDDYKFRETFYELFEKEIIPSVADRIRLNTVVSEVDYNSSIISIKDKQGNNYNTDKLILTVPITILQDGDISFNPPLPIVKTAAFQKIGMDAGMKVFLKFSATFYNENVIGGKVAAAYANEREGKQGNDHVLLAFIMGEQAELLTALGNDQAIVNELLKELDEMYNGQATQYFEKAHVENWTTHPYIRGAYSYSKVGIGNARSIAAESINNQLFFAGEAMNLNGHHQTVHGAVETGYQSVAKILKNK